MRIPLHYLLPAVKGIPVLMYHKVWEGISDRLTITPDRLKEHFTFLDEQGYKSLSLAEFLEMAEGKKAPEPHTFLLTFDDGYLNNYTLAYPLIRQFGFQATFFIIGRTLDGTYAPEEGADRKMTVAALAQLDPQCIQLALHSYGHISFSAHSTEAIKADLLENIRAFEASGLPYHKVLAYPFGARPKDDSEKKQLKQWMQEQGMKGAFRIGNQPCRMPAADLMEMKRIDIWGTDTVEQFAIKLKKGKLNLF